MNPESKHLTDTLRQGTVGDRYARNPPDEAPTLLVAGTPEWENYDFEIALSHCLEGEIVHPESVGFVDSNTFKTFKFNPNRMEENGYRKVEGGWRNP